MRENVNEATGYYIPEITDFHHGFEYERYIPGSDNEYEKKVFGVLDYVMIHRVYAQHLENASLRAKYLTAADVHKLGWKLQWSNAFLDCSHKGDWRLHRYSDIYTESGMIDISNRRSPGRQFFGFVKNKSELQRIMRQLGI